MHHLVLIFAATALLSNGCKSANVNKHMKLLTNTQRNNDTDVLPIKQTTSRKFLKITRIPSALIAHESGTIVPVTCEALGSPAPSIRWFKNDAPVYEYDRESNEVFDTNPTSLARVSSTLLISRTDNRDVYTCLATTGLKTAVNTFTVYAKGGITDITERTKLTPLEPQIIVTYRAYVDTIGTNIVLPCRVKGHPRPHITWKNNKGQLVKKDPRMKVLRSGELVISPLRWSDMGEFTCQATNAFGSQFASTFVYPAKA